MDIANLTGALVWFRSKSWLQDQINDLFIPIEESLGSDIPPSTEEVRRYISATRQISKLVKLKRGYGLNRATAELSEALQEMKSKLGLAQPDGIAPACQHALSAAKKLRRAIDRLEP
ncbi:hypothetical protein [Blastochloris sulfoviridis]|uniref:Uncharacterized protein n=1 Tax=Blastochloris sulfoviridis TaxID=50712 RepID=A0A5M6I4G8_9HYPH|nr:hypothetical protein [Blastochloris sulfoviridis]KAA5602678.1 hypothetical protein F1193_04120 [Blastochloris sulfoviridis]